ncbi:Potassium voltage gated channel subfamily H [Paragonimus heterotremus]|uniref:Potassium voltage gated channel subfamily H n=1 Tax=Paragonimus heterotremus TaxID=100268 RepID=A0A8J4WJS1_9TREM|nr:Potassium voltage gated channel subfamily H [Paragonimus heterotremus]
MDIVPIKNDKSQVVLFLVSHKQISSQRHTKAAIVEDTPQRSHRHDLFKTLLTKRPIVSPALVNPPSFLSAGLATTITAAALGTTAFRKNKLLDYIHTNNKAQLQNLCTTDRPTTSKLYEITDGVAAGTTRRQTELNQRRSASVTNGPTALDLPLISSPRFSEPGLCSRKQSLLISENLLPKSSTNLAAQTILVSDTDDETNTSSSSSNKTDDNDPTTSYKYDRRRSRAVLFHLSGRFDQTAKRKNRLKKFRTIPEYKVQDVQASRFILLHYSIFKIIWDWMILLCTFYIAIMVPYNAAFSLDTDGKDLLICDIIVELVFIVDIVINFATTFVSKSGQIVYHTREIAVHYLKGWFFLDLIAAVPFDMILAVHNREINGLRGGVGNWIHLLKLARLLRLARLFQKIERYSQYSTVILGLLMCMFFLIAHWFACGWYWLGRVELDTTHTHEYSWLYELSRRMRMTTMFNETDGLTPRAMYVSSLYFTTTSLTSVGFGNVSPNTVNEKIFSIIAMLIGALMHAAVFGNVTTLIQRMYARRSAYQTKNQDLKDFTRAHHIPKPLKQRMLEFFQAMWAINRGIDKNAIMESFPENIRGDIALHLNREMLSLSLFKVASPGCRKCLAQLIHTRFATPGEYLVNRGDLLRYIFFVCSGSLEILDSQGTVVGLLGKCDIFGSDIDESPSLGFSAYDVKSLTYCELQCIALDTPFQSVLEQYPNFKAAFSEALHKELSFNIREGFDASIASEILPAITLKSALPHSDDVLSSEPSFASFSLQNEQTKEPEDGTGNDRTQPGIQSILDCEVNNELNVSEPADRPMSRVNVKDIKTLENSSVELTNHIALGSKLKETLSFIDESVNIEQTAFCENRKVYGPKFTSIYEQQPSMLSASKPSASASCPNLWQPFAVWNEYERNPVNLAKGTISPVDKRKEYHVQPHPWWMFQTDQMNFKSMRRLESFLSCIQHEMSDIRMEVHCLTQTLAALQADLRENRESLNRTAPFHEASPNHWASFEYPGPSSAELSSWHSTTTKLNSSVDNDRQTPLKTSSTSPDKSINPRPTGEHRVVKFQLPSREEALRQSVPGGHGNRLLHSPKLQERHKIRTVGSESMLSRPNKKKVFFTVSPPMSAPYDS